MIYDVRSFFYMGNIYQTYITFEFHFRETLHRKYRIYTYIKSLHSCTRKFNSSSIKYKVQGSSRALLVMRNDWFSVCRTP